MERGEIKRSQAPLNEVVREAAELALPEARENRICVRFDLKGNLPPAHIDRIQIQQVVFNLMRNAVEALQGAERREITVRTLPAGCDCLEVRIEDTGPGFDVAMLDQFFKTFVSTKLGGMGLGLSISHSIVSAHEGRLWASETPGGGATLHFTVPVAGNGHGR